jgi:hypothetical protein
MKTVQQLTAIMERAGNAYGPVFDSASPMES